MLSLPKVWSWGCVRFAEEGPQSKQDVKSGNPGLH